VELKVTTRSQGDHAVVSVLGEIDLYTAPRLQSELMSALSGNPARLIVDMSGVEFCDSTGRLVSGAVSYSSPGPARRRGRCFR
jgi:anti-sigma B factor antagonist